MTLLPLAGLICQFDLFLHNDFGILFFLFFLFQLAMTGLAYFIAAFVAKAATAVNLGFVVFIFGWIIQVSSAFWAVSHVIGLAVWMQLRVRYLLGCS